MKIYRNNKELNINSKISNYKRQLKNNYLVRITSNDHTDHIAAYTAWREVGGNIFIPPTTLSNYTEYYNNILNKIECQNSILMPTSGTTKMPKIVVNDIHYFDLMASLCKAWLDWNKDSKFLCFIPPVTSGFWHGFFPPVFDTDSSIILGSPKTIKEDLKTEASHIVLVPNLINILSYQKINVDLGNYDTCIVGAAQMLDKHSQYMFNNSCRRLTHAYGSTEAGVPILKYHTFSQSNDNMFLEYTNEYGIETKLNEDGELLVKGKSLCSNISDFGIDENGWYHTGDLFEEQNGKIKFVARTNEIVKINGITSNLLLIESIIEETDEVIECVAQVKNKIGIDYIELQYVGDITDINKFNKKLEKVLPKCNIPKKYVSVKSIARNTLNKKIRINDRKK